MARKPPKFLKADVERGFIWAYYKLVKGCAVSLDMRGENIVPVVAFAHKPGEVYGMDFSSTYHFAEKEKPSTRYRWVKRKVEELTRHAQFYAEQNKIKYQVLYEIWCFIPPNELVTDTVDSAIDEGIPVKLVDLRELHERMRQVALLEPLDRDIIYENAFLWAAELFREAGAWK
jgi:Holliday junction resolvase